MTDPSTMINGHFAQSGGHLIVGGVPVQDIVAAYGTPLFVYDAGMLDQKWNVLRASLPPEFTISYSVKANPNLAILRRFLSKGSGLEVASAGEFQIALKAGCPARDILFAGPGKTEEELELVIGAGIGEIHVESGREAERTGRIAARLGVRTGVAIRVNPAAEAQGGAMRMGGRATPFGVDEETLEFHVERLLAHSSLEFRGIHLFSGTQILDAAVLLAQYRKGLEIGRQVARWTGRPLGVLDFGGGLGIPYFESERELDMEEFRQGLTRLMDDVRSDPAFVGTRFVVEPGRYLVGESGIYVTRVNDVKSSRGKKFVVLDGGMNHHLAASGNLGQVIKRNFPIAVLNRLGQALAESVDLVGPLCTPLDVLARDVRLPRVEVDDLVGILQSGAYARSASPLGFLSRPAPAEILVADGAATCIRRPGRPEDLFSDESSPLPDPRGHGGRQPEESMRGPVSSR